MTRLRLVDAPGTAARRAAANARMRRYRQRVAHVEGYIGIAPVTATHAIVALLLDTNWLQAADAEDLQKIGDAIAGMLEDTAKHR